MPILDMSKTSRVIDNFDKDKVAERESDKFLKVETEGSSDIETLNIYGNSKQEKILEIKNLSFSYEDTPFIENLSLDIFRGEALMILGRNGSGKSTLLKLLFGMEKKRSGEIIFQGKDSEEDIYNLRKQMAIVFQNPDEQIVAHSVVGDLAFGMENFGIPRTEMEKRIDETLELVGLAHKKDFKIEELSGGEKQRLCIASAMVMKPDILVLDEPTSMLDSKNRDRIVNILRKINRGGTTLIVVSHHLKELEFCTRALCLEGGKQIFDGGIYDFIGDLIKNRDRYPLSLPTSFQFAAEVYRNYGIDISKEIFNLPKAGEKVWQSL